MAELNFFDSETLDVVAALDDCVDCRIIEWDEAEKTLLLGFVNGYIQIRSLLDKTGVA